VVNINKCRKDKRDNKNGNELRYYLKIEDLRLKN